MSQINIEEVNRLREFLSSQTIENGIELFKGTKIIDVKKFLDTSFEILKQGREISSPVLLRLQKLEQLIKSS